MSVRIFTLGMSVRIFTWDEHYNIHLERALEYSLGMRIRIFTWNER